MTEPTTPGSEAGRPDETFEWTGADTAAGDGGTAAGSTDGPKGDSASNAKAREWLGQLQAMIDDLAEQAAPTVRQVGAKAAELAAVAGEKAGPFAHRAAEMTETAGARLAERSRALADELRRDVPASSETPAASTAEPAQAASSDEADPPAG
jgi:hypothetical protein